MRRTIAGVTAVFLFLVLMSTSGATATASSGATVDLPSHAAVLTATRQAADYYRTTPAHTTVTPTNNWSWATYADGLQFAVPAGG